MWVKGGTIGIEQCELSGMGSKKAGLEMTREGGEEWSGVERKEKAEEERDPGA